MKIALQKSVLTLLCGFLSHGVLAWNSPDFDAIEARPCSIAASLGYGTLPYLMNKDGQSALGRLAFGYRLLQAGAFSVGAELGIQSGNQMRFAIPQSTLDLWGGEPIGGRIKPMLDGLLTLSIPLTTSYFPVYALAKGGVAYRQLQMERQEVKDFSKWSPEFQAGVGIGVTDTIKIHLLYQQILGAAPNFEVNPVNQRATMSNLPTQHSLLAGVSIFF